MSELKGSVVNYRKRSYSYSNLNQILERIIVLKRLLLLSIIMISGGCATFDTSTDLANNTKQQWQFNGKFAIKTPDEKNAAKMHWSQVDDHYDINLYTLFGISLMNIKGDKSQVTINNSGEVYHGRDAQQLIYRLTRWHIPVNDIPAWLVGQVENATDVIVDTHGNFHRGTIKGADNRPWQLTLSRYKDVGDYHRPHQLLLKSGDTYFKLAITQWKIQR